MYYRKHSDTGWLHNVEDNVRKSRRHRSPNVAIENRGCAYSFDILQLDAAPGAQAVAGTGNAIKKPRIVLQAVVEPVVFGLESDQDARRLSVTRNDYLALRCFA